MAGGGAGGLVGGGDGDADGGGAGGGDGGGLGGGDGDGGSDGGAISQKHTKSGVAAYAVHSAAGSATFIHQFDNPTPA